MTDLSAQCMSPAWCWQTCSHSWLHLGCFHSLNHIIREADRVDLAMNFTFNLTCGYEDCLNLNVVFHSLFTTAKLFLAMPLGLPKSVFGPNLNISANIGCIVINLYRHSWSQQMIKFNDFGDQLTFPLVQTLWGWHFSFSMICGTDTHVSLRINYNNFSFIA